METNAISLQDKIQRLIDQYTQDKKKLAEMEEQNSILREENKQLMEQIENINAAENSSSSRIKDLEKQVKTMEARIQELQNTLAGFENMANDAIGKIDNFFPDLSSE